MSAGGSADGAAAGAVNSTHLLILGIVGGLLCIYLSGFLGEMIGSVVAGLGAVVAIVWGADAIRRVASYGLGTGVPSIGYMSLSVGVISALSGLALATILHQYVGSIASYLGPILALIIAVIIGAVIAIVAVTFGLCILFNYLNEKYGEVLFEEKEDNTDLNNQDNTPLKAQSDNHTLEL